ncbi:alpha-2-macroglobulin [Desulfonatronum sp. SC1]|uniref:alpha-2-macroglobulin family protein n=1 Tax=Desulfonatronum sp. SC1 TaxID=2109626 RepID=UPI001304FEDD|nr:alpha-2-macroglobulin [Desulfonatronum sp. SC1]
MIPFRPVLLLPLLFCLLFLTLLLPGCAEQQQPGSGQQSGADGLAAMESAQPQPAPALDLALDLEQARRDFARTPFEVLGIGEREWNGEPALAVSFSVPLDPDTILERHLDVLDSAGQPVAGGWLLDPSGAVALFPFIEPEARYQVRVSRGVKALTGSELDRDQEQWVTSAALPPAVRFTSRGAQFSPELTDGLEVEATNVAAVDLDLWQVRAEHLSSFAAKPLGGHVSDIQNLREIADLRYSGRFDLDAPANHRVRRLLPLRSLPPLAEAGVWMAVLKAAGDYPWQYQSTWFTVSDLGLHVRRYETQTLAWVHGLTSAEARSGVRVQLLDAHGTVLREVRSDDQGAALFQGVEPEAALVLARMGSQLAMVSLKRPALDLTEFTLPARPQRPQELFLYAPRDIYRPGETMILNALLRDHDGRRIADQPVQLVLTRPDGRTYRTFAWQGDDQGFSTAQVALPGDALTGRWRFQATLGNGDTFTYPVHVEDFLPERMRLILRDDLADGLAQDQAQDLAQDLAQSPMLSMVPTLEIHGEYLWGAPAAGNRVETTLRVSGARKLSARFADFLFGPASPGPDETLELPVQILDESGRTVLELPNHWAETDRPIQLQAIVSLFESGGRPVTRSWQRVLWPSPTLVGLRPLWTGPIADPHGQAGFELIHVDPEDRLLGLDMVRAELIREDQDHYWRWGDDGWRRQESEEEQTVYARVLGWADGERASLDVPVEYGRYRLELRDVQGRLLAAHRFFAGWRWDGDQDDQGARPEQVALHWDASAYGPDDMAGLTLEAPFDGHALVTVEGPTLLWQGTAQVRDGRADIRIPVSPSWDRHDLYATALVLRPGQRTQSETEQRMPRRAWGLRHLPLDRSSRDLRLTIDAPDQVLPDTRLNVVVQVQAPLTKKDMGDTVAVTLAAVDAGILSLTGFAPPDPLAWFFGPRSYSPALRDTYGDLVEISRAEAARQRFGGDADLARGGDAPLSEVQVVALFSGKVLLDNDGRAEIPLDLPWFNGEVRLMAVAFDDQRVGSAERPVRVAAPVVAEINLPRFLALGDRIDAVWDIQNLLPEARELEVTLEGDAALGANRVTEVITLEASGRTRMHLPVQASQTQGQDSTQGRGELRLNLRSRDGQEPEILMDRTWSLGLRPPYPAQRHVRRWMVPAGQGLVLHDRTEASAESLAADLQLNTLQGRLVISSIPPLDLDDQFQHLVEYPYGCLEQTASRLWPFLLGRDEDWRRYVALHPDHALAKDRAQVVRQTVEQGIGRIAGMQRYDGGFGAWRNDREEAHWLTAYAADLLLTARDHGHAVNPEMLDKALQRLGRYVGAEQGIPGEGRWHSEAPEHYRLAYRAYAALVLSGAGQARLSAVRQIYDRHADAARSPLPLAQLALALERLGDVRRAGEAWQKALAWTDVRPVYGGDYGSPVRDLAWTLLLSQESRLLAQPDQRAVQPWNLIFPLQQALRDQQWLSTQERMVLYRLALLLEQRGGDPWTAELLVVPPHATTDVHINLPVSAERQWSDHWSAGTWPARLELINTSNGPLYVSGVVQGYPAQTPPARSQGIEVDRQYYDLQGEPLSLKNLASGDWVLTRIRVRSATGAALPDVLVADFLPAGLELDNPALTGATSFDQVVVEGRQVQDWMQQTRLAHQEFRDDRYVAAVALAGRETAELFYLARAVTPGRFTVPPTQVEDMYRPMLRAVGGTPGVATVRERGVPGD